MAIEPNPLPPELPGPGEDTPPVEVPTPNDPAPAPGRPPQARSASGFSVAGLGSFVGTLSAH